MDKNSTIGLVLIAAILLAYGYFASPSTEEIQAQKAQQDSIAQVMAKEQAAKLAADSLQKTAVLYPTDSVAPLDSATAAQVNLQAATKYSLFAAYASAPEKIFTVETDHHIYTFTNKGAQIKNVVLKNYKTYKGETLNLWDAEKSAMKLELTLNNSTFLPLNELAFDVNATDKITITGNNSRSIDFSLTGTGGEKLVVSYQIKGDIFDLDATYNLTGVAAKVDFAKPVLMNWQATAFIKEKSAVMERQASSVYFAYKNEKRDYLSERSDDQLALENKAEWVAFKQYFFSAAAVSEQGFVPKFTELAILPFDEDSVYTKQYNAKLALPITRENPITTVKYFFGPNQQKVLAAYDINEFDRIIDFGWSIFGYVNKYFVVKVFNVLEKFNLGYGIIILLLTLIVKTLLIAPNYKNYLSSAKMRVIKPEVDAINLKFKDADPLKKQQEVMSLYRQTGVNPLAGCIPMLIQMPILYAMFRFFPASIELRQESFLWAEDLSSYDSVLSLPFSIPLYGDHVSLFTLLLALSTYLFTKFGNSQMPEPQPGMPDMRFIMYLFPFMMIFFFNSFASGLSYYYFLSNVVSIVQTLVIKKFFVDEAKILAKIEENKKKSAKGGKSKFQIKLEEMAKKRGMNLPGKGK